MAFGFRLITFAGLCLIWSVHIAWAAGSCHIHPLGVDIKEAESSAFEWYSSLEQCEVANKKFFGGRGMCHCFPDGFINGEGDDWRSRLRDYGTLQEPPSE